MAQDDPESLGGPTAEVASRANLHLHSNNGWLAGMCLMLNPGSFGAVVIFRILFNPVAYQAYLALYYRLVALPFSTSSAKSRVPNLRGLVRAEHEPLLNPFTALTHTSLLPRCHPVPIFHMPPARLPTGKPYELRLAA